MGFTDALRRQLRSVIEWPEGQDELLFSQWTDNGDEIKNASKLLIKPGQGCIFVYRGKIRAMHHRPGLYNLKTDNIPFITTVIKVMQFFESEHKVGIYFFRTAKVLNQKWGTTMPVTYQDPVYQFPISLKAYGNYSYQLSQPREFFANILGSNSQFSFDDLREVLSPRLLQPISDYLATASFSYAQLDANRTEIAQGLLEQVHDEVQAKLGLSITDLRIEGIDFSEETDQRINRIADVTASAIAAKQAGVSFAELQQLESLKAAAENEGGAAGAGVGIGAGIGLGQQLAGNMGEALGSKPAQSSDDLMASMAKLKQLYELEMITEDEYSDKKRELLDKL